MKLFKVVILSVMMVSNSVIVNADNQYTGNITLLRVGTGENNVLVAGITPPGSTEILTASFDDGIVPFGAFSSMLSDAFYSNAQLTIITDNSNLIKGVYPD